MVAQDSVWKLLSTVFKWSRWVKTRFANHISILFDSETSTLKNPHILRVNGGSGLRLKTVEYSFRMEQVSQNSFCEPYINSVRFRDEYIKKPAYLAGKWWLRTPFGNCWVHITAIQRLQDDWRPVIGILCRRYESSKWHNHNYNKSSHIRGSFILHSNIWYLHKYTTYSTKRLSIVSHSDTSTH